MRKRDKGEAKQVYEEFAAEFGRCWACGWSPESFVIRSWMRGELHCAHILGGPNRTPDRRNLVRLCDGCHRLAHGAVIRDKRGNPLPTLVYEHMLWLKMARDPDHYDRQYLGQLSRKFVPRPKRPPGWFLVQYDSQPGISWLPGQTYRDAPA